MFKSEQAVARDECLKSQFQFSCLQRQTASVEFLLLRSQRWASWCDFLYHLTDRTQEMVLTVRPVSQRQCEHVKILNVK